METVVWLVDRVLQNVFGGVLIKGDMLYGKAEVNSEGFFRAVSEQV